MKRMRLRDFGLAIGHLPTGPLNAITDVAGVLVGHETIIRDDPEVVRSGVTVVVPENGEIWRRHLFAGAHVLNGNGEMTGLAFLEEFGLMCGPIAITGTHSIGAAHEGLVSYELEGGFDVDFCLPLVAETFDGWLSEPLALAVRPEHVHAALRAAAGGAVAEGNIGGGTGMNAHEFKAGIGTASRQTEVVGETWTVGVLVQANYGRRHQLRLDGHAIGQAIPIEEVPPPWPKPRDDGSIIAVVATDAPLLPHQCKRLAQRAGMGVARAGGIAAPASGDIFLAFSTGNAHSVAAHDHLHSARFLPDMALAGIFEAVIEATEESIWNALCTAETMTGRQGRISHAIPLDRLTTVMKA
ncbi:P1 family peptidase [Pelagibius sp.]|uniref:P1 family peptidase n=1 Tax=Pelagibius sp. TaxID=1931238 RepID=UPI003BAF85D6